MDSCLERQYRLKRLQIVSEIGGCYDHVCKREERAFSRYLLAFSQHIHATFLANADS